MNFPRVSRHNAEAEQPPAEDRLEEVFARCQDELLGMLYYLLGNVDDARDALQEAFVKCWRRRETLEEIENLRAWVFRIALNAGRDLRGTAWHRRRRPLQEREFKLVAREDSPQEEVLHRERLSLVSSALLKLRPEEQEVFLLRQNGQLTYEQIAESVSIPVGTVKTRMRLALTKLREALLAKGENER
jgi:RNA polymerase sigma-70 factor, ECF subfamily